MESRSWSRKWLEVVEVLYIVCQREHVSNTVAIAVHDGARELLQLQLVKNGTALINNIVCETNRRVVEAVRGREVSALSRFVRLLFFNTTVKNTPHPEA